MKIFDLWPHKKTAAWNPGLPVLVFGFVVVCFVLHPLSPFFTHDLGDPDNYMRVNQVIAWLGGQSWYDLSVPRLSPGMHTVIHWSRLVDVPIALMALPLAGWLGMTHAVFIAALVVPLIYLALLMALLIALAKPLVHEKAPVICGLLLFAPILLSKFLPGSVDHHNVQLLIAGFGLLALSRILTDNQAEVFAALAGGAFACGFWVGAESLPWALAFIFALFIASTARGERVARHAAMFGAYLFVWSALLVPIALPTSEYASHAVSWFSPVYVLFAGFVSLAFGAAWTASRITKKPTVRWLAYMLVGVAGILGFVAMEPDVLSGPFKDYGAFDANVSLAFINEAQPLIHSLHVNKFLPASYFAVFAKILAVLVLPLTALAICLVQVKRKKNDQRWLWFSHTVFLLTSLSLTLFWQMRVATFMQLFMLVPLTYLLVAATKRLRGVLHGRPLFWAEIGVFALLGPLPVVLLPALRHHDPLYPNVLLFPAERNIPACRMDSVVPFLNDPAGLGATPLTIMNDSDSGPQLLFATKHRAVAGNFNVPGNAEAFTFFSAKDDALALAAAQKSGADLVLFCGQAPMLYTGKDYYDWRHVELKPGKDGMLYPTNTSTAQPMIQRLIRGEAPEWLKRIEIPEASDYLVYRIVR